MPSRREQVILAVIGLVKAALPQAEVLRNASYPQSIGADGLLIVSDGDVGDPEITFSPTTYIYDHRIPVEVAFNPTRLSNGTEIAGETNLDGALVQLGTAIDQNRTLGGLCDYIDIEAPTTDELEAPGAVTARWAEFAIIATYGTPNPLT